MDKHIFRAEIKKQLYLRKWSYADLAEHTKYAPGSIKTMMVDDARLSERAMNEIAGVLNIDLSES